MMKIFKPTVNLRERIKQLVNWDQVKSRLEQHGLTIADELSVDGDLNVDGALRTSGLIFKSVDGQVAVGEDHAGSNLTAEAFIYDTSLDSDGGAWRQRTKHTSWYNEPLDTYERGSTREFPQTALIVGDTRSVYIYDLLADGVPMWMYFRDADNRMIGANPACVYMLNGVLMAGQNPGHGLTEIDFIKDAAWRHRDNVNSAYYGKYNGNIAERNNIPDLSSGPTQTGQPFSKDSYEKAIGLNQSGFDTDIINSVAMTIRPGAPIDPWSKLPRPTVAIATMAAVSIIRDDQAVINGTEVNASWNSEFIHFDTHGRLWVIHPRDTRYGGLQMVSEPPYQTISQIGGQNMSGGYLRGLMQSAIGSYPYGGHENNPVMNTGPMSDHQMIDDMSIVGHAHTDDQIRFYGGGVTLVDHDQHTLEDSMVAYITHRTNTGWMPNKTKIALSETQPMDMGQDQRSIITDGNTGSFTSGTGYWEAEEATIESVQVAGAGGCCKLTNTSNKGLMWLKQATKNGQNYTFEAFVDVTSTSDFRLLVSNEPPVSGSSTTYSYASDWLTAAGQNIPQAIQFRAAGKHTYFAVQLRSDTTGDHAFINTILIKPHHNLISNGDFAAGTRGWRDDSNGTGSISVTNGQLTLTRVDQNNRGSVRQTFRTRPGRVYTIGVNIFDTGNGGSLQVQLGHGSNITSQYFQDADWNAISTPGYHTHTFVATHSTAQVRLIPVSNNVDMVVDLIDIVQSAQNHVHISDKKQTNGGTVTCLQGESLKVIGNVKTKPVMPHTDMCTFYNFGSLANGRGYLYREDNQDLMFGTGDFCFMWWQQSGPASADRPIFWLGDYNNRVSSVGAILLNSGSNVDNMYFVAGSNSISYQSHSITDTRSSPEDNNWHHFAFVRRAGLLQVFHNGHTTVHHNMTDEFNLNLESAETLALDLNKRDKGLRVGGLVQTGVEYTSSSELQIAMFKAIGRAPTNQQILKIYNDEQSLYNIGAKCRFNSDPNVQNRGIVRNIATDKHNKTYTVGFEHDDHLDTFQNLIRVDSTTPSEHSTNDFITAYKGTIITR